MMKFVVLFACVLLSPQCSGVPVEDSVVSVYTTQSTTAGTSPSLDVYHQIANNIAERITSPIYRFLGYNTTTTAAAETTTKQPWDKIELLDDPDLTKTHDMKPVDNDIAHERDVEELSVAGITKSDKKPEKITLYSSLSSYLPAKLEKNDTIKNEVDNDLDSLELDDIEPEKPREGPFIYVLEFFGSILQLLWGGFLALFKPSNGSNGSR
ncbi:uncharacterized protein LOC142981542 isoform X2 [Anticarsia gemmatalis]|uniref:uncharacterized protein LOC142981542 isoform X2 n=1 Tax=Anticarsia gemmatalis TaxID=129554 RepID=UPI003F76E8F8